ncbi:MAG: DUF3775 domain-containing protein [Alphaproteobacteria bacterium]|nr:DUF3775 domain-containing protein [Alphaproteobacteria bacterium SS10]
MLQNLKPEEAGFVIVKMRASEEQVELDRATHDGFVPHAEDAALLADEKVTAADDEELTGAIDTLSMEAQCELVALAWLGRGDYTANDFPQAVTDAKARWNPRTAAYLGGMAMLADYLEEGLSSLEYDLEAAENGS